VLLFKKIGFLISILAVEFTYFGPLDGRGSVGAKLFVPAAPKPEAQMYVIDR
jgi:hypothetical protein